MPWGPGKGALHGAQAARKALWKRRFWSWALRGQYWETRGKGEGDEFFRPRQRGRVQNTRWCSVQSGVERESRPELCGLSMYGTRNTSSWGPLGH